MSGEGKDLSAKRTKMEQAEVLVGGSDKLLFVKAHPRARAPAKGSERSAGFDLTSVKPYMIPPGERQCVSTGIKVKLPARTYGRIAGRSGLALKYGIGVEGGVVDEDYRGELMVLLFNHGSETFHIKPGDRTAQLIVERIAHPEVEEVESLDDTERGSQGFGSTGV